MLKSALVQRIAIQNPHLYQRNVENIVNAILGEITAALARSDRVEVRGLSQNPRGAVAGLVGIEGGVVSEVINLESSGVEARTGDHAMTRDTTKTAACSVDEVLFDNWFDPIESALRDRARNFIEELIHGELTAALDRPRYGRRGMKENRSGLVGHRHGSRTRSLTGTFGTTEITVPRARVEGENGTTMEWKSKALRAYQRRTLAADALIASAYLAGTNTRRVRRALRALFAEGVGKDVVSRVWRKVKSDWDAWSDRSLAAEPIVRLILDGTVVRVRLDRKATSISLLVVLGVRADGQKVLLAIKSMGGESGEAWRTVLDDLIKRGLQRPELLIVDGAAGLDKAIAAVWDGVPVQRCTVHKHRNLFAHAPERLHDEITADYNDMIYAATREEIEARRKAFIRK